jgi:hypothetical protein
MIGVAKCRRLHCGCELVERIDAIGRVAFGCPGCERNRRGLCRDCPRPLQAHNALRCRPCSDARRVANDHARHIRARRDPVRNAETLARKRKRYATDAAYRAGRIDYIRRYRAARPPRRRDPADRIVERVKARARRKVPAYRNRERARARERYQQNIERERARARERNRRRRDQQREQRREAA